MGKHCEKMLLLSFSYRCGCRKCATAVSEGEKSDDIKNYRKISQINRYANSEPFDFDIF